MKTIRLLTVTLAVEDVDGYEDVIHALLTPSTKEFAPGSMVLDWCYTPTVEIVTCPVADDFGFDDLTFLDAIQE